MQTIKGPTRLLAQFTDDSAPSDSWASITRRPGLMPTLGRNDRQGRWQRLSGNLPDAGGQFSTMPKTAASA